MPAICRSILMKKPID